MNSIGSICFVDCHFMSFVSFPFLSTVTAKLITTYYKKEKITSE